MKSLSDVASYPIGLPLLAEDFIESHAARLLLLLSVCGVNNRVDGLTKLAKLDFFVRYPRFFESACQALGVPYEHHSEETDATMVRFHYGPWDHRYYRVLAFMEARRLISVSKSGNTYIFLLTDLGKNKAQDLIKNEAFSNVVLHMRQVKKTLGSRSGSSIKSLIYETFDREIVQKPLGQAIVE